MNSLKGTKDLSHSFPWVEISRLVFGFCKRQTASFSFMFNLTFSFSLLFRGLLMSIGGGILDVLSHCKKCLKHGCVINCGSAAGSVCF